MIVAVVFAVEFYLGEINSDCLAQPLHFLRTDKSHMCDQIQCALPYLSLVNQIYH